MAVPEVDNGHGHGWGYMFLALGSGAWAFAQAGGDAYAEAHGFTAGMFHLLNHAFFKALLFLGAGAVIHSVHTQDMREMGGLRKTMPFTSTAMGVAVLSIAGVPFFSGFWSKDEILAAVRHNGEVEPIFAVLNGGIRCYCLVSCPVVPITPAIW